MAGTSKLSASELARIKARAAERNAKKTSVKATQKAAKPKAEPKKAPTLEEVKAAAAEANAKKAARTSAFTAMLDSGEPLPSVDRGFRLNAPNKISENTNYHDSLLSMINDVKSRVSQVKNQVKGDAKERAAYTAEKQGVPVDRMVDAGGKRRSFVSPQTIKKLSSVETLLDQAEKHHTNSFNAHHAGGAEGALSALESFTKAGDSLAGALTYARDAFKTSQKYKKVFDGPEYGNSESPVNVDLDSHEKITNLVEAYTNHALSRSTAAGIIPDNIAKEIKPQLKRNYATWREVPQVTAALGNLAPKTDEEKAATAAAVSSRRARQGEAEQRRKAEKGFINIVKPSENYPAEPLSPKDTAKLAELNKNNTASPVPFSLRWGRAQVQPVFDYNEKQNEASAAEVGKEYIKKTFVGSEAHTDPASWHEKNQVRSHWVKNTKGARPEDFESSDAAADISGYKSANKLQTKPLEYDGQKSARLTIFTPNPKSSFEKRVFARPAGTPEGEPIDIPKKGSLAAFYPSAGESAAAEKYNQIDVPEAVNKRQLARAKASGAALSRKDTSVEFTPDKTTGINEEGATTGSVAKTEAAMALKPRTPEGRTIHFMTGAGE